MTGPEPRGGLEPVLRLVEHRTGLSFPPVRRSAAGAAVRRAMARAGADDPVDYLPLVHAGGGALDDLLAELTVGETYFFRDPAQFDFVRREVLPRMDAGRPLRAWSAGCATGEEAYSLAILLREAGRSARVVGTDLSAVRLAAARRGRYTRWSLRGVEDGVVARWFRRDGGLFALDRTLREWAHFRPFNLAGGGGAAAAGIRGMDLVFCRNVLIYLDRERIPAVARLLLDSLSTDGWLFLGASDPLLAEMVDCEVVLTDAGLAYRRRTPAAPRAAGAAGAGPAASSPPGPVPPSTRLGRPPVRPRAAEPARAAAAPPPPDPGACYAAGDYGRAAELAAAQVERCPEDPGAWVVLVRALANQGRMAEAGRASAAALDRHRSSAELRCLHAVLLSGAGRHREAAQAARHALYLDREMGVAHLLLGSSLARMGDGARARRALRNAERLLASVPPSVAPAGSDGEPAGRLAGMARAQLRLLLAEAA